MYAFVTLCTQQPQNQSKEFVDDLSVYGLNIGNV